MNIWRLAFFFVLALFVFMAFLGRADGEALHKETQDTLDMPFQGYLDLDGEPCHGTYDLGFQLSRADGTVLATIRKNVDVVAGHFATPLRFPRHLLIDDTELFLGVTVFETDSQGIETARPLTNRQRVHPAVMAHTAPSDSGFLVYDIQSPLPAGVSRLRFFGDLALGSGSASFADGTQEERAEIVNDSNMHQALTLIGNSIRGESNPDVPGASIRHVKVLDNLEVERNLEVGRNLEIGGVLSGDVQIEGSLEAEGGFRPNYDSGWVQVHNDFDNRVTFNHGFGSIPSHWNLQMCGANVSQWGNCSTHVVTLTNGGIRTGDGGATNPVQITSDSHNVYAHISQSREAMAYWRIPDGGGAGGWESFGRQAWYRVRAWR